MLNAILYVIVMTVLVACSVVPKSAIWLPDERTGLGMGSGTMVLAGSPVGIKGIERMIEVPLDTRNAWGKRFDLYYFVQMPPKKKAPKTVLFIPGGPGIFNLGPFGPANRMSGFLMQNNEYNIVHFHVRGAGYSQIPPQSQYDRFLKTAYVIRDIEAIRRDLVRLGLLGEEGRWDAIIGYSFGTVVAQAYAATYPSNVKKLVLIGPESRQLFENSDQAFSLFTSEIRDTNRYTLAKIFEAEKFKKLKPEQKAEILDIAFGTEKTKGVFQKTEDLFGSLGFLIDSYCQPEILRELRSYGLDKYSVNFFIALRELRAVGWHEKSRDRDEQIKHATQIQKEIQATTPVPDSCRNMPVLDATERSDRVFYVVTTFDGINLRLLDALDKSEKDNVLEAIRRSGGRAHYDRNINKFLEKIGIADDEKIVPWNPARFRYDGPTMILKGSADTVTAGRAAEHVFVNALSGPRVLIGYPGIGHNYRLPLIPDESPTKALPNSNICKPDGETRGIRDCLIYSFLQMTPDTFINPTDNKILPVVFEHKANVCFKDPSGSKTIAGECP
jgi:pimeloyl-ACP methyl ester carboxylesterase